MHDMSHGLGAVFFFFFLKIFGFLQFGDISKKISIFLSSLH
jgi:hypothetical protein